MRIPVAFYLFGQKITVEKVNDLIEKESCTGIALYRKNVIQIQRNNNGVTRPVTQTETTFLHELIHWIFYMQGEKEMCNNEKFVDVTARLLHQALSTAEYAVDGPDVQGGLN